MSTVQQQARLLTVEYAAMSWRRYCYVTVSQVASYIGHLRSMMGQDRLWSLALLSIEAQPAESLETDQIIDTFANA